MAPSTRIRLAVRFSRLARRTLVAGARGFGFPTLRLHLWHGPGLAADGRHLDLDLERLAATADAQRVAGAPRTSRLATTRYGFDPHTCSFWNEKDAPNFIKQRHIENCRKVDSAHGVGAAKALGL